jgi:putative endonuclease
MTYDDKRPCVYILASKRSGTLYVGVTTNPAGRISAHKQDLVEGFTKRYGVHRLVYVEHHHTMPDAIARETQLKRWRRAWKVALIERENPEWRDIYTELTGYHET